MNLNGTEYYYLKNAQGDIIGLTDNTGTQVVSYTYDSCGKLISITGSLTNTVGVKNPYRYRGYRYDTETGLYYLQSRYYNPEWGRFINNDSIDILKELGTTNEVLTDANLYTYCGNNPVVREDNDGDFWGEFALAGGGSLGISLSIGGSNFWNPVGWVIIGITTIAVGYKIYTATRAYNQEAEHTKKTRCKKNKHQEGQRRKQMDKGREKGDKYRIKNTKRYVIPK